MFENAIDISKVELKIGGYIDPPNRPDNQIRLFGAENGAALIKELPTALSYEHEIHVVHNQTYATCYCEAAVTYIEWLTWKHTGEKIAASRNEIHDLAADYKGKSYSARQTAATKGGMSDCVSYGWSEELFKFAYAYNSEKSRSQHYFTDKAESKLFKAYKNIVDERLGGQIGTVSSIQTKAGCMRWLFERGPFCYSIAWNGINSERPGNHEVLAIGYDQSNLYIRNSYGSADPVAISWSRFEKDSLRERAALIHPLDNLG